ncbi:hypothetical protein P692DRAFT_20876307 [Suillus brevipes Sb2]|nr:hypothetical protein P692DRAFT_20876307 [Suillus brevipes Sb2]
MSCKSKVSCRSRSSTRPASSYFGNQVALLDASPLLHLPLTPMTMNNLATSSAPVVEYDCGHTKVSVDEFHPCGACIGHVLMPACCIDLIATATVSLLHRPEHANNFYSVVRDIMSDINHANFINDREETNGEKGDQGDEAGQDGEVTHTPNSSPSPLDSTVGSFELVANTVVGFLYHTEHLELLRCVIRDVVLDLQNRQSKY